MQCKINFAFKRPLSVRNRRNLTRRVISLSDGFTSTINAYDMTDTLSTNTAAIIPCDHRPYSETPRVGNQISLTRGYALLRRDGRITLHVPLGRVIRPACGMMTIAESIL